MKKESIFVIKQKNSQLNPIVERIGKTYTVYVEENLDNVVERLKTCPNVICILLEIVYKDFTPELELLSVLQRTKHIRRIPVIVVSNRSDDEFIEKLAAQNVSDFIYPPFSDKFFELKINNCLKFRETSSVLKELELDDLTGLYTRQAFLRRARDFIDSDPSKEYAILALDFENFKFTNNQYGEEKCDEFLAYIGTALKQYSRRGFAGRFGGDQFIAVYEYNDRVDAKFLSHYIETGLSKAPIPHQQAKLGVYAPVDKTAPVVSCCDRAFLAIREIKGAYGQSIAFYKDDFQHQLVEEQKILDSMEEALSGNQFRVYYQPKHESVSGKIAGCEALVRWIHPEFGFMNPGQFVPLFEKNGFITKLDSFVVKQVCQDISNWKKLGVPIVPISINVSRRDYLENNWMQSQLDLIDSLNIEHSLIHFEVTESLYAEYMDLVIEQVRKVQKQDFMIEMDDFGSGYSSLGLLSSFPLNIIKLDISFVRHIEINEIVIENIIKMAHRMGLTVVAEGAETKEQFRILKDLGCDLIQGYCFSKPLPSDEFEEYIKKNYNQFNNFAKKIGELNIGTEDALAAEYLLKAANEFGENIPGGFFTYHADGNHEIISFNQELLKIFDCDSAREFREFTGNSFDGMVLKDDADRVTVEINSQITDENDINHVKYRILSKKGKLKYIDDYGRFVKTKKYGNLFYVYLNDITQIHEQHIEVQKRNEVIQGLSLSYSSIFLVDFKTRRMSTYAVDNEYKDVIEKLLAAGTTYDKVVVAFADKYVISEERDNVKEIFSIENIQKEFQNNDFYSFTFHMETEGVTKLTELSVRKLQDENMGTRAVIALRIVSENMVDMNSERNFALVDALEKSRNRKKNDVEKLKQAYANAEKEKNARMIFMSEFSENIHNPLNKIRSYSQNAIKSRNRDEVNSYLNEIFNNSEIMLRKINNVQVGAKIGSGAKWDVNMIACDSSTAIEKLKLNIADLAKEKNIRIEAWSNIKNPLIYQDLDKTSQACINVIENAIKYTPNSGTVTFYLNQIETDNPDECIMEFVCRDNGIGISNDFLPHIFEPFSKEDNHINRINPSSGLGLCIAKAATDKSGGTIEVISEKGRGTEVKIINRHKYAN